MTLSKGGGVNAWDRVVNAAEAKEVRRTCRLLEHGTLTLHSVLDLCSISVIPFSWGKGVLLSEKQVQLLPVVFRHLKVSFTKRRRADRLSF